MKTGYVYLLTNKNNTVIYTGVTSQIEKRIFLHKIKYNPKSFSARYNLNKLVYYESFSSMVEAIGREKQIKAGSREKKVRLINSVNSKWDDLYEKFEMELD